MRLDTIFKALEFTVLRNSGVNITPQQVGLTVPTGSSGFSSFLTQGFSAQRGYGVLPAPPTPPEDPSKYTDINQYHQDLIAYQQKFQVYQTQLFQSMMFRMQQLQQATLQTQQQQLQQSKNAQAPDNSLLGVGGILDSGLSASDIGG